MNGEQNISQNKQTSSASTNLLGLALPDFVFDFANASLSSNLIKTNRDPNEAEIHQMREQIGQVFDVASTELADSPADQNDVIEHLLQAKKHLTGSEHVSQNSFLEADNALKNAVAIWAKYKRSAQTVRHMVWVVICVVSLYAILFTLIWLQTNNNPSLLIFGIPPLVVIWGGLGGITAVLFRHRSTMEKHWPFDFRWLWIVFRPLLGAIMGAFLYLVVVSGLLVFGFSIVPQTSRPQLLWGLAFIGGVSDRLWEVLINTTLGPFGKNLSSNN